MNISKAKNKYNNLHTNPFLGFLVLIASPRTSDTNSVWYVPDSFVPHKFVETRFDPHIGCAHHQTSKLFDFLNCARRFSLETTAFYKICYYYSTDWTCSLVNYSHSMQSLVEIDGEVTSDSRELLFSFCHILHNIYVGILMNKQKNGHNERTWQHTKNRGHQTVLAINS